jgi:hypothetical protein
LWLRVECTLFCNLQSRVRTHAVLVIGLSRTHQTRRSGRLLRLGFNEVAQFVKKRSFSRPVSLFKSVFFSPIIILFLQYSHVLEMWPIQGLMFNILFQTSFLRSKCSTFVFVKGRRTCGSGERNVKIWIDFRKSPRFSLTSPLSQEREKSSRPVFSMCGEPWAYMSC